MGEEVGGCQVEEMQDDTVVNKCQNMFQKIESTLAIQIDDVQEKQFKATGKFNFEEENSEPRLPLS